MRTVLTFLLTSLLLHCQSPVDWTPPPGETDEVPPGEAPPASRDDPDTTDTPPSGEEGPLDDPTDGDEPTEDEPPDRPVDRDDDPGPEPDGLVRPGGTCDCDADCQGDSANPGLCIHGICGSRATTSSCSPGSTAECPSGQRCWSGTGMGICYPDYVAGECEGVRDGDGSCVSDGAIDCYSSCGDLCGLSGGPDDDPDPDPDPDTGPDPDPEPPTGDLTAAELDLFNALNDERASYGLPAVEIDDRLMCAARNHALDVGSTGTCGHVGSDGSWPWDRAEACGFPQDTWTVNEIAAGPGFTDGADAVWGWRHSDGHHAAIVHPDAQYVGVGVHNTCFIALFDCCVASM